MDFLHKLKFLLSVISNYRRLINRTGCSCFVLTVMVTAGLVGCHNVSDSKMESDENPPFKVTPMLISELGSEHFGNAVYRRSMNGPRIDASGSRILEWPIQESAPTLEVVPAGNESYQNGACVIDVNGDNIDEMVVGRSAGQDATDLLWYEEVPGQQGWKEHFIDKIPRPQGSEGFHDIMPFEMSMRDKNIKGVVISVNRRILYWYQAGMDPAQPWQRHLIADLTNYGAECAQSGLVLGNISGHGRQDIVSGNFWMECPADPATESWKIHRYSHWDRRKTPVFPNVPSWVGEVRFGGMNQLDLGDMDGDGLLDIIASDAEIPEARVGVFCRNLSSPDSLWNITLVDSGLYCLHSLVVADVNNDKLPDIIAGEMTAGGWWFPRNPNPRIYLYLNEGQLKFKKFIISEGLGVHMMRMAPAQKQNKIFVFAADEIQSWYKDMITHVVG